MEKIIIKGNDIFLKEGKNKRQVAQIVDYFPQIKYTTKDFKAFFLYIKPLESGKGKKLKIKWFYRIADFKQWVRESVKELGWIDFCIVNGFISVKEVTAK